MDRRAFGLRPLAQPRFRSNLSDSSSEDDDGYYHRRQTQKANDGDDDDDDFQSSSETSSDDSSDSTYEERRDIRYPPVPRQTRRRRLSSSEGSNWSGSESSGAHYSRATRSTATGVSYKEKSSDSSEEEEEEDADDATVDDDAYTDNIVAEDGEEVETIEKVLRCRVGRKGATGSQTVSYIAASSGDPNANLDPIHEEIEDQYLIKWKNWSHIHNSWESEEGLKEQKVNGMKKLENFKRKEAERLLRARMATREEEEYLACQQEVNDMLEAQHSIAERIISSKITNGLSEYLVKWEGLPYSSCTTEDADLIERLFPKTIEEFFYRQNNTCIPNPSSRALRFRPKFIALKEQPFRIGQENQLKLRDYQQDGLNWLLFSWCKGNGVILADEMGLGKTIQTISFLEALMSYHEIYGPFLVIVPLSTITTWNKEFKVWAPHINVIQYLGDADSRTRIRQEEWSHPTSKKLKFNVLLSTYEIILKDTTILSGINWAVLIVDEAHRLKNDESLLYKSLMPFRTNHRLLITGTPLQNSLKELWALLHFLMPRRYDRWEDFEECHKSADKNGFQSLHTELSPFLLRRVKKDVEKSLPAKVEQILRVEMSKLQKQYYKLILTKNYRELSKEAGGKVSSFINIVMELKKCCNHAYLVKETENGFTIKNRLEMLIKGSGKLILLDKLLLRLKATGHRVLIFSQMVRMLDILADYLRLRKFAFQRLDGSIKGEIRKQALDHFNAEGSPDFCFLLSTRAGGLGLNLATADTVIIFDSDWNPQNDLQAQARAHRIGQKNQVSVYRLVSKNTVEEDILERAKKKMVLDHLVIQRMDTTGRMVLNKDSQNSASSFSKDELNAILKFGAEELFKENDDEDGVDLQVDIDDILRRAETRNAEEMNNSASSELLSCFKVVSLESMEEEETEVHQQVTNQGRTWEKIIPEVERRRIEDEELHQKLVELNPPPRSRKKCHTVNYNETGGRKRKRNNDDHSTDSEDVPQPKKRGRPKNTYTDLGGLDNAEINRLLKSLKKFGRPLERVTAISQDSNLLYKSEEDLTNAIRVIISKCEECQKESGTQLDVDENSLAKPSTFKLGKTIVNPRSVLQAFADLEPLCMWAQDGQKPLPDNVHLRDPHFDCPWSREDDFNLLKGVYRYGYGSWDTIRQDEKLQLSKILPETELKPQSKNLSARVEYLLKKILRFYEGGFNSKKLKPVREPKKKIPRLVIKVDISNGETVEKKPRKKKLKTENHRDDIKEKEKEPQSGEMDAMSGLPAEVFEECKEAMRPVRKALRGLDDNAENTECVLVIGNHIKGLLSQCTDAGNVKERRSNLWYFVSEFTKRTAFDLYRIYKNILKSSKKDPPPSNHSEKTSKAAKNS